MKRKTESKEQGNSVRGSKMRWIQSEESSGTVDKERKYRLSFRIYFALVSIVTLCSSLILSYGIVLLFLHLVYQGEMTPGVVTIVCLSGCLLTIVIGGTALWMGAKHLTGPVEEMNQVVKRVAEGDFTARVERRDRTLKNYRYTNEIDELAHNFNTMAAELEGMDYMRKDFMSNVSHEVKTPVAAITGFTEMLLDEHLDGAERKEYLQLVHQESLRLSRLSDSMLKMSRLDHQEIITRKDTIRIDEQIRKCIIMLAEKWNEKEMDYALELEPVTIVSDSDLLQQVWMNLLDNAIKYSEVGTVISVNVSVQNNHLIVKIADCGEGIPKEKQERIFDKFYQCDKAHGKEGSGLGLSIVKRIIELLQGTIECQSQVGHGTSMLVSIPIVRSF